MNYLSPFLSSIMDSILSSTTEFFSNSSSVIPNINISLNLPNLSLVTKEFISKGYQLADSYLYESNDSISNIDFVLGSKSLYCLKTNQILFGPDKDSIYAESDLGVLLLGEINKLLKNLSHLYRILR